METGYAKNLIVSLLTGSVKPGSQLYCSPDQHPSIEQGDSTGRDPHYSGVTLHGRVSLSLSLSGSNSISHAGDWTQRGWLNGDGFHWPEQKHRLKSETQFQVCPFGLAWE